MRVKLLPLAISAAVAMPAAALADGHGPKVYGKMNVTMEMLDHSDPDSANDYDRWELNSNASRVGVKGSEKINDNLEAFYKAEFEIFVDDGEKSGDSYTLTTVADGEVEIEQNGSTFSQRDIYVGLKGGWGSVRAGKFDTALKKAQNKIDRFNDYSDGDIKYVLQGENRVSDTIEYKSPKLGDAIVLTVGFQPGEGECTESAADTCDDGIADTFSTSAVYSTDALYAALAYDDGVDGYDTLRLVLQGFFGDFDLGFLYQTAEESEGDTPAEEDGYILSGAMKVGAMAKVYAQYGYGEIDGGAETTQFGLGYSYSLSKQTKLFTHYIMLTEEEGSNEDEDTRLAFGVEHKF